MYHTRGGLAIFHLVLICLILANSCIFIHRHRTAGGEVVIHTHPYNLTTNPGDKKNNHSNRELIYLDVVFHGTYLMPAFVQPVFTCMEGVGTTSGTVPDNPGIDDVNGLANLRAPPGI